LRPGSSRHSLGLNVLSALMPDVAINRAAMVMSAAIHVVFAFM